jgi:hypothetical protein
LGGTEVRYDVNTGSWLVHVHLLALGADEKAVHELKRAMHCRPTKPVVVQRLADPVLQLSYLQKFATYHRPGEQCSQRRTRAYPLPSAPRLEVLRWMAAYGFDDFRFLFGARRKGGSLVLERG